MGHSYDGAVIRNAAYNNPNVTGLVYVAAFAPDEGQSLSDFVDVTKLPSGFLQFDKGGFSYINPAMFHEGFVQDVTPTEADIMAIVQKPAHQYQISESDRIIPPNVQKIFAEQMNATTISLTASHASLVSHKDEIAELILNASKGSTKQPR